jgi:hypothetical protein
VALGALQPLANFLNANVRRLVWAQPVIVDALLWLALVLAAFVGVRLLTRRSPALPIAAAFVAFNLSFWNFWRWLPIVPSSEVQRWLGLLVWALVTAVLCRLAMKLAELRSARTFIVIFLGVWTAALLVSFTSGRQQLAGGDLPVVAPTPTAEFTSRPNVYWFLLDEHARSDRLLEHTGSDNSWFSGDLAERGFSVSESSTSAYLQTHLSITSTLAMEYAWTPGHDYRSEYGLAATIFNGENPVVGSFEANGYRYVGAPDGTVEWARCPDPGPDRSCIEPVGGPFAMREPHSYLVWSTPVGSLELPQVENSMTSITAGIDDLRADDRPFFMFAHLLSPHFPYRYEADCSYREHPMSESTMNRDEHAAAYANEVQCLDHEIVTAVDDIVAHDPDAVIIIQSDHGSAIDFSFIHGLDTMPPGALEERFGVLNAIRLPAECRDRSIEGQPLVNTFRIVLACLDGTEPDLLATRHFFSEFARANTLEEVSLEGEVATSAAADGTDQAAPSEHAVATLPAETSGTP